jgi:pilus assembly protein CpaB
MNTRGLIVLAVAIAVGVLATKGVSIWVDSQVEKEVATRIGKEQPMKEILVASADIPAAGEVTEDSLQVVKVSDDAVPPGAILASDQALGRFTRTKLYAGEALIEQKLAPPGSKGGLQSVIPDGLRAMTVKVNDVSGVAGFILPGSKVDVVGVFEKERDKDPYSKIIVQAVEVLAIDQLVEVVKNEPKPASAITLLVSPRDAERVALTAVEGEIRLALRGATDQALAPTQGIDTKQLISRPVTYTPPPVQRPSVEVIENDRRFKTRVKKGKESEDKGPSAKASTDTDAPTPSIVQVR